MSNFKSLWTDPIPAANHSSPVAILQQQAGLLGRITQGILEGAVESEVSPVTKIRGIASDTLIHNFYIKAMTLNGYRHRLFYVTHECMAAYPVEIYSSLGYRQVINERGFRESVKDILNSAETKNIVRCLLDAIL
jgi:hypothetical protein